MKECWECGITGAPLHEHHPVPRSRGGAKTISLCGFCHGKAHHMNKNMSNSALTREGLRAAKARGVKLGNPNMKPVSRLGVLANKAGADAYAKSMKTIISGLVAGGVDSHTGIARELNAMGIRSRTGKVWYAKSVSNLRQRLKSFEMEKQKVPT